MKYSTPMYINLMIFTLIVSAVTLYFGFKSQDTTNKLNAGLPGYTYYLDGNEIDNPTIDFNLYRYRVDNVNKHVYITSYARR